MAQCIKCGDEFDDARKELGYKICTECGEVHAQKEIERKKTCVAPAFNKGPYQYVSSEEQAKWLGKK